VQARGYEEGGELRRDAAISGSQQYASGITGGVQYLRGVDAPARAVGGDAFRTEAGLYGLEGGKGSGEQFIEAARQDPLFAAIMQTRDAGEDAIMRNAAATGGLRSGNVQSNLYQYNQQLEADALTQVYDRRLEGIRGLQDRDRFSTDIAGGLAQRGKALGGGRIDAADARASGIENAAISRAGGMVSGAEAITTGRNAAIDIGAKLVGSIWSDRRLKDDVEFLSNQDGINFYQWTWNALAAPLGLFGNSMGVMADEIEISHPDAMGVSQGYKTVDYQLLGV